MHVNSCGIVPGVSSSFYFPSASRRIACKFALKIGLLVSCFMPHLWPLGRSPSTRRLRRRRRPLAGAPANIVGSATSPTTQRNRRNPDWTEDSPDRSLAAAPWLPLSPLQSHRREVVSARWSSQDHTRTVTPPIVTDAVPRAGPRRWL